MDLAGELGSELGLVLAVLRQAIHDMGSRRPDIRADAQHFWDDPAAVEVFAALLDIDTGRLQQAVRQRSWS
jgi:hypothetical protein